MKEAVVVEIDKAIRNGKDGEIKSKILEVKCHQSSDLKLQTQDD